MHFAAVSRTSVTTRTPHILSGGKQMENSYVSSGKDLIFTENNATRLPVAEEIGDCLYAENIYALKTWLKKTVKEGDLILFLGAGDIYYVAQYLLKELK